MSTAANVLALYNRWFPPSQFDSAQPGRCYVYTPRAVTGLMILQSLLGNGTQAAAVDQLLYGAGQGLRAPCKQVRENRVSSHTGAYCQGRQRLSKVVLAMVHQGTIEQLAAELQQSEAGVPPVFVLDGSTLPLQHVAELVQAHPPGENQHGNDAVGAADRQDSGHGGKGVAGSDHRLQLSSVRSCVWPHGALAFRRGI